MEFLDEKTIRLDKGINELDKFVFKEEILKSDKDIEDALHLRKVFKDKLNINKLKEYKRLVKRLL